MRVVQAKRKYEKIWSACFVGTTRAKFGGSEEDYGIRPEGRALDGDKRVFVYFLLSSKSKKKKCLLDND